MEPTELRARIGKALENQDFDRKPMTADELKTRIEQLLATEAEVHRMREQVASLEVSVKQWNEQCASMGALATDLREQLAKVTRERDDARTQRDAWRTRARRAGSTEPVRLAVGSPAARIEELEDQLAKVTRERNEALRPREGIAPHGWHWEGASLVNTGTGSRLTATVTDRFADLHIRDGSLGITLPIAVLRAVLPGERSAPDLSALVARIEELARENEQLVGMHEAIRADEREKVAARVMAWWGRWFPDLRRVGERFRSLEAALKGDDQ